VIRGYAEHRSIAVITRVGLVHVILPRGILP
jgi:hypothetical protein